MTRSFTNGALCAAALALAGALALTVRADDPPRVSAHHAAHFDKCARACSDCQRECDVCARHCADLVADGKKEHLRTLGTCADCADVCAAAARVSARGGPLAMSVCDGCAKACD